MSQYTRAQAKDLFQIDDQPTQQQFANFLDSLFFKTESGDLAVSGLKEYNPSGTYIMGMTCIKNNVVYEANEETGGTWDPSKWSVVFNGILHERVVITDASVIRDIGGTPILLLTAPGSGLMSVPVKIVGTMITDGTAFSGEYTMTLVVKHRTADSFIAANSAILFSTVNRRYQFLDQSSSSAPDDEQLIVNDDLVLTTMYGEYPADGFTTGKMIIDLYYLIEDRSSDEDSGSGSGSG